MTLKRQAKDLTAKGHVEALVFNPVRKQADMTSDGHPKGSQDGKQA